MQFFKVESSNIDAVAWEDNKLFVRFHHGGVYRYDGVPYHVFPNMVNAPSVGKFFISEVKSRYPYSRVEEAIGDV